MLNDNIEISLLEIQGEQVRIGINAPRSVTIFRKEIFEEIQEENKLAASSGKQSLENVLKGKKKKDIMKE